MQKRYIYAVTKQLPKDLRKKTEKELNKIIRDRMNRLPISLSEDEKIDRVLRGLGDPKKIADN